MFTDILVSAIHFIHFLLVIFPFIIYFFPKKYFKGNFKYIFLIFILIPLHWEIFDGCLLTNLTNYIEGATCKKIFSEEELGIFYRPITKFLGLKWPDDIKKTVSLHWMLIFISLWYYAYFYNN